MATQQIAKAPPDEDKAAQIVQYDSLHGPVSLSVNFVRTYFCDKATPSEAFAFMQVCRFHKLNPFLREVYLVKYGQDSAQIILGYQSWTQRAENDATYRGFTAGIILQKEEDGPLEWRPSTFYLPGETLVGGWCEVRREDRPEPVRIEVALEEYIQRTREGAPNRFWREKPGTMIRKVALAQAHREAYPSLFAGLYEQAEGDTATALPEDAVIIDAVPDQPPGPAKRATDADYPDAKEQLRMGEELARELNGPRVDHD